MFSLYKKSAKYQWAAEKYEVYSAARELLANTIFDRLVALEGDGYYASLFQNKLDEELSDLINKL